MCIHARLTGSLVKALDSTVTVEGGNEEADCAAMEQSFKDDL